MKSFFSIRTLEIAAWLVLASCSESERRPGYTRDHRSEAAADRGQAAAEDRKKRDSGFVFETVADQYGEIKLAELGVRRSHAPEIRKLEERLIADHSTSLNELKTLAKAKNLPVPVEGSDASKKNLEKIADESGKAFDGKWCSQMLEMKEESVGKFEKRLEDTGDPEVRTYIGNTLPALKDHLESLRGYREKLARQK